MGHFMGLVITVFPNTELVMNHVDVNVDLS